MFLVLVSFLLCTYTNLPNFKNLGDVVYTGVENNIFISFNGCDPEKIEVKVNVGTLNKRNDSLYVFIPQIGESEVKIKLYYQKVLCAIKVVQVKKIPEPVLILENENQGFIKMKDLTGSGKLSFVYPEGYPENNKSKIISFSVLINDHMGRVVASTTIRGDRFDENMLNHIKNLSAGATIIFSNIITQNIYQGNALLQVNKQITIVK